jgi:hypothetical protein
LCLVFHDRNVRYKKNKKIFSWRDIVGDKINLFIK